MPPVSKPSPSLIGPSRIPCKTDGLGNESRRGSEIKFRNCYFSSPSPPLLVFTNTFQQRPILVSLPIADTNCGHTKTETPPFSKLPKNRTSRLQSNVRMTPVIFPKVRFFPREILFFSATNYLGKRFFFGWWWDDCLEGKRESVRDERGEDGKMKCVVFTGKRRNYYFFSTRRGGKKQVGGTKTFN